MGTRFFHNAIVKTAYIVAEAKLACTVHLNAGHDEADLAATLTLRRKLGSGWQRPKRFTYIVAVEVRDAAAFSESLNPEVQAAVPKAVAAVEKMLPGDLPCA